MPLHLQRQLLEAQLNRGFAAAPKSWPVDLHSTVALAFCTSRENARCSVHNFTWGERTTIHEVAVHIIVILYLDMLTWRFSRLKEVTVSMLAYSLGIGGLGNLTSLKTLRFASTSSYCSCTQQDKPTVQKKRRFNANPMHECPYTQLRFAQRSAPRK